MFNPHVTKGCYSSQRISRKVLLHVCMAACMVACMERLFEVESAEADDLGVSHWRSLSTQGQVSEILCAAKLLELGHRVAVPIVDDDGVDLVVNYRTTVQVKSSGLHDLFSGKSQEGRYYFFVFGGLAEAWHADVLILRGVTAARDFWWVLPRDVVPRGRGKRSYSVAPPGFARRAGFSTLVAPFLDKWEVFD